MSCLGNRKIEKINPDRVKTECFFLSNAQSELVAHYFGSTISQNPQPVARERPLEYRYTTFGRWAVPGFGVGIPSLPIKPDILNFSGLVRGNKPGLFNEIKPLNPKQVSKGIGQTTTHFLELEPYNFIPDIIWHAPPNVLTLPGIQITGKGATDVLVFNIGGILFYIDDSSKRMKQSIQRMIYRSFAEGIEKTRGLLLVASNSSINELGRSKYLIDNAQTTMYAVDFAILTSLIAVAALARA